MKLISIIVPCLNEQEVIPIFYRTVTEVLDSLENAEYELLFVDDGSDDLLLPVPSGRKPAARSRKCGWRKPKATCTAPRTYRGKAARPGR